MQEKTFEAKELPLQKVFNDDYHFSMPLYQRPYAWTKDETQELLDDMKNAMNDEGGTQSYFLGSIVLINAAGSSSYEVIDGQQRLTTLTILFCVLRELSTDKEIEDSLDKYVREKGNVIEGTMDRFRLSIRERDNKFFQDNVQKLGSLKGFVSDDLNSPKSGADSRECIKENAKLLWDELSNWDEEERINLAQFITQQCYLVVVSASDSDSANRIFSVLNARGVDLSSTDILKSEIIGNVTVNEQYEYTNKWEDVEADIGRDNFEDLFRHIHMIYVKQKPSEKTLDKSFKKEVLEEKLKDPNGVEFIDDVLEPYSEAYKVISDAAYESASRAEQVNGCLQNMKLLNNTNSFWIAPAMEFYDKYGDDVDMFYRLIKDLERLTYGLLFLSVSSDSRRTRYHKVLDIFENREDAIFECTGALQFSDNEKQIIKSALDEPLRNTNWRKPFLLWLDSLLADAESVKYEHKITTIEHVLPQNPPDNSEWLKHFPCEEYRDEWTNKLANLVLLSHSKNSRASNRDFAHKKNEYFRGKNRTTTYALTNRVIMETEWTPKVLERRQKELIDVLAEEWRLK